jgi:putative flippase GtrA
VLVSVVGLRAILAQACAVLVVTPIGFVGQKLWSFRLVRVAPVSAEG